MWTAGFDDVHEHAYFKMPSRQGFSVQHVIHHARASVIAGEPVPRPRRLTASAVGWVDPVGPEACRDVPLGVFDLRAVNREHRNTIVAVACDQRQLHDREALLPREGQRRFLEGEGWVAWPGPALAEFVNQFVASNRMVEGGFVIADRLLSLAELE